MEMMVKRRFVTLAASAILVLASVSTGPPAAASVRGSHLSSAIDVDMNAPNFGTVPDTRPVEIEQPRPTDLNHATWGLEPNSGAGQDGMISLHTVYPNLGIGTEHGEFLYAPTMKPANSCIEMTTVYGQPAGASLWAWDWCRSTPGPARTAVVADSSFLPVYTKPAPTGNGRAYLVRIQRTNPAANTWTASLFNYKTAVWNLFYTSSGTPDPNGSPDLGWDMFEAYSTVDPQTGDGYYCASLANTRFDSTNIRLLDGTSNSAATASNSSYLSTGGPFFCPRLSFTVADSYNSWTVYGGA